MAEYIERDGVLAEYDRQHQGPPGGARKIIAEYPAADVKPVVRGKWVKQEPYEVWKCSACKEDNMYAYTDGDEGYELQDLFCPNCGADMREQETEQEPSDKDTNVPTKPATYDLLHEEGGWNLQ